MKRARNKDALAAQPFKVLKSTTVGQCGAEITRLEAMLADERAASQATLADERAAWEAKCADFHLQIANLEASQKAANKACADLVTQQFTRHQQRLAAIQDLASYAQAGLQHSADALLGWVAVGRKSRRRECTALRRGQSRGCTFTALGHAATNILPPCSFDSMR